MSLYASNNQIKSFEFWQFYEWNENHKKGGTKIYEEMQIKFNL